MAADRILATIEQRAAFLEAQREAGFEIEELVVSQGNAILVEIKRAGPIELSRAADLTRAVLMGPWTAALKENARVALSNATLSPALQSGSRKQQHMDHMEKYLTAPMWEILNDASRSTLSKTQGLAEWLAKNLGVRCPSERLRKRAVSLVLGEAYSEYTPKQKSDLIDLIRNTCKDVEDREPWHLSYVESYADDPAGLPIDVYRHAYKEYPPVYPDNVNASELAGKVKSMGYRKNHRSLRTDAPAASASPAAKASSPAMEMQSMQQMFFQTMQQSMHMMLTGMRPPPPCATTPGLFVVGGILFR